MAISDSSRELQEFNDQLRDAQQEFASLERSVAASRERLQTMLAGMVTVTNQTGQSTKKATDDLVSMVIAASKVVAKEIKENKGKPTDDITKISSALSDLTQATIPLITMFKGLKASMAAGDASGKALRGLLYNEAKPVYKWDYIANRTMIDPVTKKPVQEQERVVKADGTVEMKGKTKAGWDFGAFKGERGAGQAVGAYTNAAFAAIGAVGALDSATNVRGKGKRALAGAATGASIGTQIMPGWGTAIGAGVGALVGLIRKPGMEDVYNRVKERYGGIEISDDTAKAIDKQAKKTFKGDRRTSEVYSLDQIIKEGGGIKDTNVKDLTARLRDAFVAKETGKFTDVQLTETLDKNFGAFAEHVVKSKELASKEFTELIQLNKRFGSESQAIQAFLTAQTGKVGAALAGMAAPLLNQFAPIDKQINSTKEAIKRMEDIGEKGSVEYGKALETLAGHQAKAKQLATDSAPEFERLGIIAMGAFNAAVQGGTDYVTAMQQMGPALDQLIKLQTDHGVTTENAALKELIQFREKVENNKALVLSADALGDAMLALSSIGGLNVETFKAMEEQGGLTFQRLLDAGFTENEALMQMREFLDSAKDAHEQLGFPIDENTERLIKQAEEAGILKKSQEDMNKGMQEGLKKCTDALMLVAKGLGVDIPAAVDDTTEALARIPNSIDVNVNYRTNGELPDLGNSGSTDGGGVPGWANGTGGFRNFGSGTLAMLHGWEAVIPMNQLRGGGAGGQGVEVNVWLNDAIIGRAAARGLPAMLDVYGATR